MRIVVVGGSGLVGRQLSEILRKAGPFVLLSVQFQH
jgi:nucleoside-diphosphate-sugar epimerase